MKRAFLSTSFCIISLFAFCQGWAPVGATWTYEWDVLSSSLASGPVSWTSIKDTTLDNHLCSIILRDHYRINGDFIDRLISYEDSNVVYLYDSTRNQFSVLYDFNKNAGESWLFKFDTLSLAVTVDSTGYDTINGQVLKMQYVSTPYPNNIHTLSMIGKLTQHIGFNKAMLPLYFSYYDGIGYGGLRCYNDSAFGNYNTHIAPSCEYETTGIEETTKANITIYPNPTSGLLFIKTDNPELIKNITITSVAGQVLIYNGNNTTIDMKSLSAGTYIVQVRTIDGVMNRLVNKTND